MMKPLPPPRYMAAAYTHVHTHTHAAHDDIIPRRRHKVVPLSLVLLPAGSCGLFSRPGMFTISATQLVLFLLLLLLLLLLER